MDKTEKFNKFYTACKTFGLSNFDVSILLNVTPAMVTRYKANAENIGKRGDTKKLERAAKAFKALRSKFKTSEFKKLSPTQRVSVCLKATSEADPELEVTPKIVG